MDRFKKIDETISEGYELTFGKRDYVGGCSKWLLAWEDIKSLFTDGIAEDIYDLNDKYEWINFPTNYVQDLEPELHNAGIDDISFHRKRITFCQELIKWCKDELIISNTRAGMGEAYFDMNDFAAGDRHFEEWLNDDPLSGKAYSSWANCYRVASDSKYEKTEEILLAGYQKEGLRDKHYVVDCLILLYSDNLNRPDKAKEYQKIYDALKKPASVRVVKIGRNDPCPCGSGKKYKKCCLP